MKYPTTLIRDMLFLTQTHRVS